MPAKFKSASMFAAIPAIAFCLSGCEIAQTQKPETKSISIMPARMRLLTNPRDLREDYTYPHGATSQALKWANDTFEWRINFPPRGYAYGGLVFRKPVDFTKAMDRGTIVFRIKPAELAPRLTVALIDSEKIPRHILIDTPIINVDASKAQDGWAMVSVPFSSFPLKGIGVDGDPLTAYQLTEFDWSDIREIRIGKSETIPRKEITIRGLRFEY